MRTSRIFFVMFFLGALLVCGNRSAGAQDGDGCEGLGDYRTAMLDAGRDYLAALEDAGVPAGSDRDPLTYSSSEWDALAAASADYQGALRDIEPPAFAADWHRAQIELRGLAEQVAKAAAKDGVLALAAFTDAIEQNETD